MKVKLIPAGLILFGFLFCLINYGQATVDPWWENRYPGEHPWQHEDSPGPGDSLGYSPPHIVILPINFSIKVILLIPCSDCINGLSDGPHRIESDRVQKLHFRKEK
jgi:hypothetical protein